MLEMIIAIIEGGRNLENGLEFILTQSFFFQVMELCVSWVALSCKNAGLQLPCDGSDQTFVSNLQCRVRLICVSPQKHFQCHTFVTYLFFELLFFSRSPNKIGNTFERTV